MVTFADIDQKRTGENIRRLRNLHKYSVRQIQDILGLGYPQSVHKWENGKNLPSIDNLVALAWLFDVTFEQLIIRAEPTASTT